MTRIETVARAIAAARGLDYGKCDGFTRQAFRVQANDAIEANDAWLKERGWKAVPQEATENMLVEGACCLPATPENSIAYSCWEPSNSTMREDASNDWRRMWNEAPEEPDQ